MSSWIDYVGYLAAFSVLATFCMNTIVPLRAMAIVSNVLFILYGIAAHIYPVFLLHAVLLPINTFKIIQPRLLSLRIIRMGPAAWRKNPVRVD